MRILYRLFEQVRWAESPRASLLPVAFSALLAAAMIAGGACSTRPFEDAGPVEGFEGDAREMLTRVREKHRISQIFPRLERQILEFESEQGRPPSNLVEMVETGYMKGLPHDGESIVYDFHPESGRILTFYAPETLSDPGWDEEE